MKVGIYGGFNGGMDQILVGAKGIPGKQAGEADNVNPTLRA